MTLYGTRIGWSEFGLAADKRGKARVVYKAGEAVMKAIVDTSTCVGCGLCADTCPEVFEMNGDVAQVIATPVPANAEETCKEAAGNCPVDAIAVTDD